VPRPAGTLAIDVSRHIDGSMCLDELIRTKPGRPGFDGSE